MACYMAGLFLILLVRVRLSGLIGDAGAVGIFKSNPGSGAYVGGFLADGSGNCTTTGNPFNADCKGNIDQRVQLCLAWEADGLPNGVTVAANCAGDPAITAVICADQWGKCESV